MKAQRIALGITDILDRITDGLVAFDRNLTYVYANRRAGELLGRTPEELIGKNYWQEYPEARGTPFANAYLKALETHQPIILEDYYQPWDRWFENRIYPSKDGLTVFFTEVTERKKTEKTLEPNERLLERILETVPNGIAVVDCSGQIVRANAEAERILGLARSSIAGRTYDDVQWKITAVDGSPFPLDQLPVAQVLRTGAAVATLEHALEHPDGRRVILSVNAAPLKDETGSIISVVTSFTDITERTRNDLLLLLESRVLKMVALQEPLTAILEQIVLNIEALSPETIASILLLDPDGIHLRFGAAPHLPDEYNRAIEGESIGPAAGSCGTAAYRKERVIVTDIETDPLWKDYRALARAYGLRACWSTPIINAEGRVLGTFALYYREPRRPTEDDLQLIEYATHLTLIAIERALKEEALRESREKFSVMFEKAPFAAALSRLPDGAFEEVNEEFETLFGYSRTEAIGRTSLDLGMYPDPDVRMKLAAKFHEAGSVRNAEVKLRMKSGDVRDFLVNTDLVEIGTKKHLLTIAKDITARKRAEEALRESERRLREMLENLELIAVFLDPEGRVTFCNEFLCRLTGWKREEILGADWFSRFIPDDRPDVRQSFVQSLARGEMAAHDETPIVTRDGRSCEITWNNTILRDADGNITGSASIGVDVTARKQAEKDLRKSREQLKSLASHLQTAIEQERRRIALAIHDELGQSLTGLKMDLAWLVRRLSPDDTQLQQKLESMLSLTNSTIQTVRRIATELRPGVLDDLGLVAAIEWQARDFESRYGIRCTFSAEPEVSTLEDDKSTALFRITQESLTNVARHAHATEVHVRLRKDAGVLTLEIEDNGTGIRDTNEDERKTLGLIGMRERAATVGGTFSITSNADKGTLVQVTIPMQP